MPGEANYLEVTAMVIESRAIGENDRRVVLLTRQMGKISAFARNSRRPNSSLLAATGLFCYGTFRLYAGRDSYTLTDAKIDQYFPYFRNHQPLFRLIRLFPFTVVSYSPEFARRVCEGIPMG